MERRPIRVLIVDDHAMLRRGLKFFLKSFEDLELVGEATSGQEALLLCARFVPDVVLMDMLMPDMDGATATGLLRERYPQVQVLVLTGYHELDLVERALEAGAIGYLLKNVTAQELAHAIREAHAGRSVLAPEAARALIQATRQKTQSWGSDLTEREKEVLTLMAHGLSNAEIAERLVVSAATVKFHVHNIMTKLGVSSRTEAVARALRQNLIKPDLPAR